MTSEVHKDDFIKELNTEINKYFVSNQISRFANKEMYVKMIFYVLSVLFCYTTMLNTHTTISFIIFYLLTGLFAILAAINMAHDAAHNVVFKDKKWNEILYWITFQMTGYNPDTWRNNHVLGHHSHPNVHDKDPHFPDTSLFRFAPWQQMKSYHRYQHTYAVFFYSIHAVIYFFVEETIIFLGKHPHVHLSKKQLYTGIFGKTMYIVVFLIVPYYFVDVLWYVLLGAFLLKHVIISIIMTLVLGINHFTEDTFILEEKDEKRLSWAELQLGSTVDFATETQWVYWIFGGFNAHALHHLFPSICHTHYRKLTPIFKEVIHKYNLPYQEVKYFHLLSLHFKYLKKMGSAHG
jgi:linoleoyl-CoA desaturase